MTVERWLPIPSCPSYSVSDQGRVRSEARTITDSLGRTRRLRSCLLRPGRSDDGYYTVSLHGQTHSVHVLVLTAFTGPRPPGMEGCHEDNDKTNNWWTNLRWDTHRENALDIVRAGIHYQQSVTHCPLEHALAPPNLHASLARKGRRACLACHRARANQQHAEKRGRVFNIRAAADAHYARITTRAN